MRSRDEGHQRGGHRPLGSRRQVDLIDFHTEPVLLARELAATGIRAMKIWPFDPIARQTGRQWITPELIRQGVEPLRLIREAMGDLMEVAMEFHGFWNLPSAIQIAQALEPYQPLWLEEMVPQDNPAIPGIGSLDAAAAVSKRTARDPLGLSGAPGKPCRAHRHARPLLVRRSV